MTMIRHTGAALAIQPRIRKGAFFEACWRHGCRTFSVYNRTFISSTFSDPVKEYWKVVNEVAIWPVMGERQVEISGRDASAFVQFLTTRNMAKCQVNQCKYALITAPDGGIISDPIVLRLDEDRYWLSTSDCDLELWARGVAVNNPMQVAIRDAEVSVLQVQGPKSPHLMSALFGEDILDLRYYWLHRAQFRGRELKISRTGWSGEFGYEIYLEHPSDGDALFDALLEAGAPHGVAPGAVSQARRIESGILSWGTDMTPQDTPFDLGLDRLVEFDAPGAFIGRAALAELWDAPRARALVGLVVDGPPLPSNEEVWPLFASGQLTGKLTSLAHSPRLKQNIALGHVAADHATVGTAIDVATPEGSRQAVVSKLPFIAKRQTGRAREMVFGPPS
ncbi:MAG: glycine cleavage T C-terminal barrel domain-containing protein [Pseudomonadota bacterium]